MQNKIVFIVIYNDNMKFSEKYIKIISLENYSYYNIQWNYCIIPCA